jgi:predicted ATPase
MITQVRFKNLKALRDLSIPLSPLTVIAGPNACGKTTVLEGMELVCRFAGKPDLADLEGCLDPRDLFQHQEARSPIEIQLYDRSPIGSRSACLIASRTDEGMVAILQGDHEGKSTQLGMSKWTPSGIPSKNSWEVNQPASLRSLSSALGRPLLLRLDRTMLSAHSKVDQSQPKLASNGAGLASVLAHLKLTDDERFDEIERSLISMIPEVKKIIVQPSDAGGSLRFDMKAIKSVPGSAVGEGTLYILAMLTMIMSSPDSRLFLVDELDRGLHPRAAGRLVELLKSLLAARPDIQIVATTHSPYLVDRLAPEEVRLMALGEDGGARCSALSDHPEFEKWKDVMYPGELWSAFGERWVTEQALQRNAV